MKAIGIILAGGNNKLMKDLSKKRAIAAMPVAGSYRAIDFALSNMSNSRINKVAVITQYNARSLNEAFKFIKVVGFRQKAGRTVRIYTDNYSRQQLLVPRHGRFFISESELLKDKP